MAGYENYSKSNNAVQAEADGLLVSSVAAKRLNVCTDAIVQVLEAAEWHHTSSWYNATNYYDIADLLDGDDPDTLAELKAADKKIKAAKKDITVHDDCTVKWIEWSGSRKHPVATKMKVAGCTATVKGKTATIQLPDGQTFQKRLSTRGFSIG